MSARTGRYSPGAPSKFKYHPLLKVGKCRETYELAHAAWRAGALAEFRYGARSKDDPTIVWTIGSTEFAQKNYAGVVQAIRSRLDDYGIANVELGATWCGFRECIVTYETGAVAVQRYDGVRVVIDHTERHLIAVAS